MPQGNARYFKAAFLVPYNLIALGGAGLLSLVALDPLPALAALGLECLYLAALPSVPGFQRLVRRRLGRDPQEEQRSLDALLAELSASQKESYLALRGLRDQTLGNYRRLPGGEALAASAVARFDGLMGAFVRLLSLLNAYRRYLASTDRQALQSELSEVRAEIDAGQAGSEKLQQIKERRTEILQQRLERLERACESREVISHQLASIEDFLRLMYEQSVTMSDPATIGSQLERLTHELHATDETVREMERFMAITDEVALVPPAPDPERVR